MGIREVLTREKAASTIEYIGVAAVILALIATLYAILAGPGGVRIGEATREAIRTLVASAGSQEGDRRPLVGGEPAVSDPAAAAGDSNVPAVLRPVIGVLEFLGRIWRGPGLFQGRWFKTDQDQPAPSVSEKEEPPVEKGPEPRDEPDATAPESRFGALLEEETTGKTAPDVGEVPELDDEREDTAPQPGLGELLEEEAAERQGPDTVQLSGVPVLHQKSVTADSLREGMRGSVNHYREYGCLPTCVSAVTQYFASQGKGEALSPSEVMNLFYDNQMWTSGDGSSASDDQLEAVLSDHGFKAKTHYGRSDRDAAFKDVKRIVQEGTPVIASLGRHPVGRHAVVITGFKDGKVFYNDSYTGKAGAVDETTFAQWWIYPLNGQNKYPYIVIEPK